MGTIIQKLSWLIARKKEIVNLLNSKTNYNNNVNGTSKPFTGKYSDADWTDIVKHADTLYPTGYPEVIYVAHYNNGTLDVSYPYYHRPGVSLSVSRTNTGIYNCNLYIPDELDYRHISIMVMGGHRGTNYNDAVNAGVIYKSSGYLDSMNFEVRTSDDDSLNDATFTIIIMINKPI